MDAQELNLRSAAVAAMAAGINSTQVQNIVSEECINEVDYTLEDLPEEGDDGVTSAD